jgi:hypothetical protein
MQSNNLLQINFGILLSSVDRMHRKKVGNFGESLNDYPNRIILLRCLGKTNNKIHADVFPLPRWNRQWLECTGYLQMTGFNSLAGITFGYILSNFSFHSGPPKVSPKVLVHFSTTRINRKLGHMCFIKDLFTKLMILRYNNTIVEP